MSFYIYSLPHLKMSHLCIYMYTIPYIEKRRNTIILHCRKITFYDVLNWIHTPTSRIEGTYIHMEYIRLNPTHVTSAITTHRQLHMIRRGISRTENVVRCGWKVSFTAHNGVSSVHPICCLLYTLMLATMVLYGFEWNYLSTRTQNIESTRIYVCIGL